ncbi:hypothetical protein N9A28_04685 [Sulfurimonas sp.]|nr:hypothetical protein [Sulfurimonas sp.]
MIYSKLKIYFKTSIAKPSIDFKWDTVQNKNLFAYLQENFPDENISEQEHKDDIKKVFQEHFEPIGYILLTNKENIVRIKVFPYKIEPKNSLNLEPLIHLLEDNEEYIEYDYHGKEDLISIGKALKDGLFEFLEDTKEAINKKELVKHAVREAFELESGDIVIVKNDCIIIKMIDESLMRNVNESEKNTVANRFNGINEDDLKSFYNDIFLQDENQDFFYFVAEMFVDVNMLTSQIDNQTYEKNVFSSIQSIIIEQLTTDFDHNDEFFKGFAGYVFRIHFKEVFGFIAELILAELSDGNKYINEFLQYYSLDIVVLNGKKYKVPAIEAENGWKWNVASMISIIKVYMKAETTLIEIEDKMSELKEEIEELNISGLSPLAHNTNLIKEIDKLKQEISYGAKKLDECLNAFTSSGDNTKHKNEVREIRYDLKDLREQKDILESHKVSTDIVTKYTDLKRDIDALIRQEAREERIIEQNSESFELIKEALVKALTSKKTLIG